MMRVSRLNVSQIATWDNLDGYVEDLIRISYQATWGQLTSEFNTLPLNLIAHEFAHKLQAVVSKPRVIGWYCVQSLVLVSAALLWMLQRRSNRPIAIDAGVVSLLVDATPVLDRYDATQELSRMSYVTGCDGGTGKTVRLVEHIVSNTGEKVELLGHYDSNTSETAPLVEREGSNTGIAKPPVRFALIPQAHGG
jgi:hypothetical protein